eukprot:TRINITY_DN3465_c0_g1_i1.p1 TRINITY_DN3465_c0_g1~~TRINITY_DN3465_c0_g1_i1.p1  ORF type:complete len:669 (+),score=133.69 TRINITY_DN3465_c0_g1_i1:1-2007(+)
MKEGSVSFRVPATSANLGPGFDCLGVALDLHLAVSVTVARAPPACAAAVTVTCEGEGAGVLPADETNLIVRSARRTCELCGTSFPAGVSVAITARNELPLQAGLGSSSAAIVAGVLCADFAADLRLGPLRAAEIAAEIEGHADNVAPAMLGGFVCATYGDGGEFSAVRVPLADAEAVRAVVVTPQMTVSTEEARKALPQRYSRADVVHTVQRVASLVAMMATPSQPLAATAGFFDDCIHQPYRAALVPGMREILALNKDLGKYPGVLGVAISGSGPTVMALCRGAPAKSCEAVSQAVQRAFAAHRLTSRSRTLAIDAEGAYAHYERATDPLRRASFSYVSTRGGGGSASFADVVLGGMPADGGLYVPARVPDVTRAELECWAGLKFAELVPLVIAKFSSSGDISLDELRELSRRSFSTFPVSDPLPLTAVAGECNTDRWLLLGELFHGPTHSFKDVALQFLGNLFLLLLQKKKQQTCGLSSDAGKLTILGATSGDTGSAAIYGFRSKPGIHVFMLHPYQRVSEVQRLQMLRVHDANVHNLAVRGTFDDCQRIVKELFGRAEFRERHALGAVNSINWARIALQSAYYFHFFFRARRLGYTGPINFCVPSGNFGDAISGYYAKRMGLPIGRIIVATNENNILHRFFATGEYTRAPQVKQTPSPSMDIQVS